MLLRVAGCIFVTLICVTDGHVSYADSASRTRKMDHVRLINAPAIKAGAFPYVAAIFDGGAFVCTGTLLDNQLVVTAASSLLAWRGNAETLSVRIGSRRKTSGGVTLSVKLVHTHPSYKPGLPEYDVATLALKQNVIASPLHSANTTGTKKCSPKQFYSPMWYKEGEVNGDTNVLRVSRYKVANRQWCRQFLSPHNITLTNNIACLLPDKMQFCLRAGGAPLVDRAPQPTQLWGVVSAWTGPECHSLTPPLLAARLTSRRIRDWLRGHARTAAANPPQEHLLV